VEILLVLSILALALILFAGEWLRVDITALVVLILLTVLGLIDFKQAFEGFSNPAVITVIGMFVLSAAMVRTGVAAWLGQIILQLAGKSQVRLLITIMLAVGIMSAFMNNIAAVAILMPAVMGLAKRRGIAPTKLLIPLAFSSLLGGLTTLIGTPPNILVSMILIDNGYQPFSMFSYLPTGLAALAVGLAFLATLGWRLLPEGESRDDLADNYGVRQYVSEVLVPPNSPLAGLTLRDSNVGAEFGVTVLAVLRDGERFPALGETQLQADDILMVEGSVEDLLEIMAARGLKILPDAENAGVSPSLLEVAEATIAPRSAIVGHTIKELDFRHRYGLNVIAIRRHEVTLAKKLGDVRLEFGDVLLLQGTREHMDAMRQTNEFLLLEPVDKPVHRTDKAVLAVGIMLLTIIMAASGLLHISVAAMVGAVLAVLLGCIDVNEAYGAIEWRAVVLIGAMLPMGTAMQTTGTATFLANQMVALVGDYGPIMTMAGLYLLTMIITQTMSHAAAAVLMAPIAISLATSLGVAPHPYMMAIAIAASSSFGTPIGHQASVLVYAAANYRFFDFTKVGVPLALLVFAVSMAVIPVIWPF